MTEEFIMNNRRFGMNRRRHTRDEREKNGRNYVETVLGDDFEAALDDPKLLADVDKIRAGEETLKQWLPFYTPYYIAFADHQRDQAHIIPEAFTYCSVLDVDDRASAKKAADKALQLNDDKESVWHDLILRIVHSPRSHPEDPQQWKIRIDFQLPIGMTIAEAQEQLASDLDVPIDKSVQTPERIIYLTPRRDEIWRSARFNEELSDFERMEYAEAFAARGLTIDGRPNLSKVTVPIEREKHRTKETVPIEGEEAWQMMQSALCTAGLGDDFGKEGERHENLKRTLAKSGVCQVLTEEQVTDCIRQIDPDWWQMDEQDIRNLVRDFTNKYKDTPVRLVTVSETLPDDLPELQQQKGVRSQETGVGRQEAGAGSQETVARQWKAMWQPLPDFMRVNSKNWPTGVRLLLSYVDEDRVRQALTCHSPAWGMCAENITGEGPLGYLERPLLMSNCIGLSGSGKNNLQEGPEIITEPAVEQDQLFRKQMEDYKQALKGKAANKELARPKGWIRIIALDATSAARAQLLTMGGDHILYTLESEAGYTMSQLESGSGQGYSPIKVFTDSWSKERLLIDRASSDGISASIVPALNMTGFAQPKYIPFFARYLDQGYVSRVCWTHIDAQLYEMPRKVKRVSDADRQTVQAFAAEMMKLPKQELRLPKLRYALLKWMDDTLKEASARQNVILGDPGVVGRLASNAFRTGLWMTAAWMVDGRKGGDSPILCQQMTWLATYWAEEYEYLFGEYVRKNYMSDFQFFRSTSPKTEGMCPETSTVKPAPARILPTEKLLSDLGDGLFTAKDIARLRPDLKDSSVRSLISKQLRAGTIKKVPGGYMKN